MKRHSAAALSAQLADRLAIEELNAAFCRSLDSQQYDDLADLLTPDALYRSGPKPLGGSAAVVAFFKGRAGQIAPRTTRHMQSGLRLSFAADGREASGLSVAIAYAGHGPAPVDQAAPFMVADFQDVYLKGDDGLWRIKERIISPVLRNPDMAPQALANT